MMEGLKQILEELDDAIEYNVALGHDYTRHHQSLIRKRRIIKRAIKAFEKENRRLKHSGKV